MFFYPEPALVSAVVGLALLLPLAPLDEAGGVVSGQADVAAAGRGADSAPRAPQEEGLGAEGQLHPAGQRHGEGAVGADPVQALGVVCGWVGGRGMRSGQGRSGCGQWCKTRRVWVSETSEKRSHRHVCRETSGAGGGDR